MNKLEALEYLKEHATVGCVTMLLDIYDDYEDVPDDFITMMCLPPVSREPLFLGGATMINNLERMAREYELTNQFSRN